jgi:hypothetical protein
MTAYPPATLIHRVDCGAQWRPVTTARLHLLLAVPTAGEIPSTPAPRCTIQASVSCRRISSPAASPANRWQAALPPRHHVALLHRSTAIKAATPPRCRRQAPGDKASRSASASSFLPDTACGPSSLQLPSPALCRHRALARPCVPRGCGQHPPCPAYHPDAGVRTKFPPLVCPSRCPLLPSLCSTPRERTLALPPHRVEPLAPSLSPCAGPQSFYAIRNYKMDLPRAFCPRPTAAFLR